MAHRVRSAWGADVIRIGDVTRPRVVSPDPQLIPHGYQEVQPSVCERFAPMTIAILIMRGGYPRECRRAAIHSPRWHICAG